MGNVGRVFGLPWEERIADEFATRGGALLYMKSAMYPVLEVTVRIRERSREQFGALEEAVLGMLAIAPMSIEQLGFGLGMPARRVDSFVEEIVARGLAARDESQQPERRYRLETLGKLSLKEGAIVFESEWTLRLCGITGRPLPSWLYERTFVSPNDLRKKDTNRDNDDKGMGNRKLAGSVILESHNISLGHLDVKAVENPRSINLPAETLEITGVLSDSANPGYLHGTIVCYRAESQGRKWQIHFGRKMVDWLDERRIIGMIEPLGSSNNLSKDDCLQLIQRQLEKQGCQVSGVSLCEFGNPNVTLKDGNSSLFRSGGNRRPLGLYAGTSMFPAIPLTYFVVDMQGQAGKSRMSDLLRGRGLMVHVEAGSRLEADVDIFRRFSKAMASVEREYLSKRSPEFDLAKGTREALQVAELDTTQIEQALTLAGLGSLEEALARIARQM